MARGPRKLDAEAQLAADMVELMGYASFHRFLFTVMSRSGISAVAYGSEVATSYSEGRRSLGIDILRMADNALPVRSPDGLPYAAMAVAIAEGLRSTPQEQERYADPRRPQFDEADDEDAPDEQR